MYEGVFYVFVFIVGWMLGWIKMDYNIRKFYSDLENRFQFYALPKPSFFPSMLDFKYPRYSPNFDTPEKVIDYMDKKSQECLIDPKTARRGVK